MLTLYQFPGPWDVCSASPFCAKLEAFLRWQNIPYKSVTRRDMRGAPKGKLPYIEDEAGKFADSNFILAYLIRTYELTPDAGLSDEQKAIALGFHYLCEESLYWALVYVRWIDKPGWDVVYDELFRPTPKWMQLLFLPGVKSYVRKQLYMQGMGRYTREEIFSIASDDLKALSDYLGDKKYFFGDTMTLIDLTVFSVFSNFITGPFDNPINRYAKRLTNLVDHTNRVRKACFGV